MPQSPYPTKGSEQHEEITLSGLEFRLKRIQIRKITLKTSIPKPDQRSCRRLQGRNGKNFLQDGPLQPKDYLPSITNSGLSTQLVVGSCPVLYRCPASSLVSDL